MQSFTITVLGFLLLLVITQDFQIFPGAFRSRIKRLFRFQKVPSKDVESYFVHTKDNKKIEVWKMSADPFVEARPYVAIIFHGNGDSLESFLAVQYWFSSIGITNYSFDYRGYGRSSGWPSESGIEKDSDALMEFVQLKERVTSKQIIIFGHSIGGSPAARLAALNNVKVLILVSTFISLKKAVAEQFPLGFLAPFVWYRFPTIGYVSSLSDTHLILAHGENDRLVRPYHTERLKESYQGKGYVERITLDVPGHNSIFIAARKQLAESLLKCL